MKRFGRSIAEGAVLGALIFLTVLYFTSGSRPSPSHLLSLRGLPATVQMGTRYQGTVSGSGPVTVSGLKDQSLPDNIDVEVIGDQVYLSGDYTGVAGFTLQRGQASATWSGRVTYTTQPQLYRHHA